jgi:DNA-binding GntR family transcriptional regulator
VLLAGAHSPPPEETLRRLQARVRVLRATSLSASGRPKEAVQEIRTVVEAVEAGDADRAAEACVTHVRSAARTALARLAELSAEGKLTPDGLAA